MSKLKIFNDPIYGLVSFPYAFIYDLIDHPYFQRLRRIQQLGMSGIVYPGATHTRFHHALGALHLGDRLIYNLKQKGIRITSEEHEATLIAILLHDIGHGPYSHALEQEILPIHHEDLTIQIMNRLNEEYNGRLNLAIRIFKENYDKPFLSQMISGQLDVDRMDYLNRDSFYTGVAEGVIGYDRILKMMNVVDNQLVIEEKGIHSIEKFLLSRHFMYHQVYLHHAALAADHMLKLFFKEYKKTESKSTGKPGVSQLKILLNSQHSLTNEEKLTLFLNIDDSDIICMIKTFMGHSNVILSTLATGLINRKLFGVTTKDRPFTEKEINMIINEGVRKTGISVGKFTKLVNLGKETSELYEKKDEIKILRKKDNSVVTFGNLSRLNLYQGTQQIFFITYPKVIV